MEKDLVSCVGASRRRRRIDIDQVVEQVCSVPHRLRLICLLRLQLLDVRPWVDV